MEEIKLFEMREERHQVNFNFTNFNLKLHSLFILNSIFNDDLLLQIKKRIVYEELAEKFTEANFPISWESVQKKWQNLMSTYWRNLKKQSNQWEYFHEMDKILRQTTVWVGQNGCKDPSQPTSLHYNEQTEDRFWSTERILHLIEEMKNLDREEDGKTRRNIFHKIALNFHRSVH